VICRDCPLPSGTHFHNTGVAAILGAPEGVACAAGAEPVRDDPFNCLGDSSSAATEDCAEPRLMTVSSPDAPDTFQRPRLRSAASRAPDMHMGQIATLDAVIRHSQSALLDTARVRAFRTMFLRTGTAMPCRASTSSQPAGVQTRSAERQY